MCICGHCFVKEGVTATKSKRIAMQANRALESIAGTALRQEKYSVSKLQKQALYRDCGRFFSTKEAYMV